MMKIPMWAPPLIVACALAWLVWLMNSGPHYPYYLTQTTNGVGIVDTHVREIRNPRYAVKNGKLVLSYVVVGGVHDPEDTTVRLPVDGFVDREDMPIPGVPLTKIIFVTGKGRVELLVQPPFSP